MKKIPLVKLGQGDYEIEYDPKIPLKKRSKWFLSDPILTIALVLYFALAACQLFVGFFMI